MFPFLHLKNVHIERINFSFFFCVPFRMSVVLLCDYLSAVCTYLHISNVVVSFLIALHFYSDVNLLVFLLYYCIMFIFVTLGTLSL